MSWIPILDGDGRQRVPQLARSMTQSYSMTPCEDRRRSGPHGLRVWRLTGRYALGHTGVPR